VLDLGPSSCNQAIRDQHQHRLIKAFRRVPASGQDRFAGSAGNEGGDISPGTLVPRQSPERRPDQGRLDKALRHQSRQVEPCHIAAGQAKRINEIFNCRHRPGLSETPIRMVARACVDGQTTARVAAGGGNFVAVERMRRLL
jgi:hypothetical protein